MTRKQGTTSVIELKAHFLSRRGDGKEAAPSLPGPCGSAWRA